MSFGINNMTARMHVEVVEFQLSYIIIIIIMTNYDLQVRFSENKTIIVMM